MWCVLRDLRGGVGGVLLLVVVVVVVLGFALLLWRRGRGGGGVFRWFYMRSRMGFMFLNPSTEKDCEISLVATRECRI